LNKMGRKKREYTYLKPFCYFCDKAFNNELVLHQHMKAKHFRCPNCNKKFSTASSMCSHSAQVHKQTVSKVQNAIPGRDSVELNIFGMQGVPRHFVEERILAGAAKYWENVKAEQTSGKKREKYVPMMQKRAIKIPFYRRKLNGEPLPEYDNRPKEDEQHEHKIFDIKSIEARLALEREKNIEVVEVEIPAPDPSAMNTQLTNMMSSMPGMGLPGMGLPMPGMGGLPMPMPGMPGMPGMSGMPGMPGMPGMGGLPMPGMPGMPGMTSLPNPMGQTMSGGGPMNPMMNPMAFNPMMMGNMGNLPNMGNMPNLGTNPNQSMKQ